MAKERVDALLGLADGMLLLHRRNRDGNSTRKFNVGVFTRPGPRADLPVMRTKSAHESRRSPNASPRHPRPGSGHRLRSGDLAELVPFHNASLSRYNAATHVG